MSLEQKRVIAAITPSTAIANLTVLHAVSIPGDSLDRPFRVTTGLQHPCLAFLVEPPNRHHSIAFGLGLQKGSEKAIDNLLRYRFQAYRRADVAWVRACDDSSDQNTTSYFDCRYLQEHDACPRADVGPTSRRQEKQCGELATNHALGAVVIRPYRRNEDNIKDDSSKFKI
jgi:hypothetical protein